jgi:hypothetical protein
MALPVDMSSGFGVLGHWSIRNSKSQITNIKQITMTEIRNSKPVLVIGYWNLGFHKSFLLHHSITPADSHAKERLLKPPWGQLKATSSGPGFFTVSGQSFVIGYQP